MGNLSFWTKTKGKAGGLRVNLPCNGKAPDTPEEHTAMVRVPKYRPRLLDGQWHEVVIPLADLSPARGFNPGIISELQLGLMAGDEADLIFFIDDIGFGDRTS